MRKFISSLLVSIVVGAALGPLVSCGADAGPAVASYLEKGHYVYSSVDCEEYDTDDNGRVTCTVFEARRTRRDDAGVWVPVGEPREILVECPSSWSCSKTCREVQIMKR